MGIHRLGVGDGNCLASCHGTRACRALPDRIDEVHEAPLPARCPGCGGRQFIFPTTSPTQFDPDAAHCSLDLIVGLRPRAIYVTHYSQVREIARLADDMHRLIAAHEQLARKERYSGAARHA